MDKSAVALEAAFALDHEPLEAQQPRDRALDDPAVPVAPQLGAVLPAAWRDAARWGRCPRRRSRAQSARLS